MATLRVWPNSSFPVRLCVSLATLLSASLLMSPSVFGSITFTVDKLDASDGIPLQPADLVVVDMLVTPTTGDAWTATGIVGATSNGAALVYAYDPNTGAVLITAPGTADRFVTFFSAPRGRDAPGRFGWNGRVSPGIRYCIDGPPITSADEINQYVTAVQPETNVAGYLLRVALDLSGVTNPQFQHDSDRVLVATQPPPNSVALFRTHCLIGDPGVNVSGALPPFNYDLDFGIYGTFPVGDLDQDGDVDLADLAVLLSHFGTASGASYADGDLDGNGTVDLADLALLLAHFGTGPP